MAAVRVFNPTWGLKLKCNPKEHLLNYFSQKTSGLEGTLKVFKPILASPPSYTWFFCDLE